MPYLHARMRVLCSGMIQIHGKRERENNKQFKEKQLINVWQLIHTCRRTKLTLSSHSANTHTFGTQT